jgi:hypothetical protein
MQFSGGDLELDFSSDSAVDVYDAMRHCLYQTGSAYAQFAVDGASISVSELMRFVELDWLIDPAAIQNTLDLQNLTRLEIGD